MKSKQQKTHTISKLKQIIKDNNLVVKSQSYRLPGIEYAALVDEGIFEGERFEVQAVGGCYAIVSNFDGGTYLLEPYNETDKMKLSPKGGYTRVEIETPNGKKVVGSALCSPRDNYDHKFGFALALGRAIRKLDLKQRRTSNSYTLTTNV